MTKLIGLLALRCCFAAACSSSDSPGTRPVPLPTAASTPISAPLPSPEPTLTAALTPDSTPEPNPAPTAISTPVPTPTEITTLEVANRLFPDDEFSPRREFLNIATAHYGADLQPVDLRPYGSPA